MFLNRKKNEVTLSRNGHLEKANRRRHRVVQNIGGSIIICQPKMSFFCLHKALNYCEVTIYFFRGLWCQLYTNPFCLCIVELTVVLLSITLLLRISSTFSLTLLAIIELAFVYRVKR